MRTFMRLFTAVALLTPLTACDQGDDSITPAPERPAVGAVAGTVSVEGEGVSGITVQLGGTASASTTTGANGAYSFPDVVEGNYSVMIGTIPADYAFAATTQNVTIRTTGQVATADFNGAWVRTASVLVQVQRGDGSPVATSVNLRGEDVDQTLSTDAQGTMLFTALKRGEYTASLVSAPEGFEITSQIVSVKTAEAAQINFVGERELLPPTVTVASIVQAGDDEEREELNDINEDVLVFFDVNPNGNQLTSVEFWALEKRTGDVYRVGTQRFASTVEGPELVEGIYRAEFYFNQYDFIRRRDGSHPSIEMLGSEGFEAMGPDAMRPYHPIFADGDYEFHGVVTVAEFPGETFNALVDVTLTEGQDCCSDRVILRVEADNSDQLDFSQLTEGQVYLSTDEQVPAELEDLPSFSSVLLDDDGYRWHSGDILIDAYPVIYSAPFNPNDPTIARLTLNLDLAETVESTEPNDDGSFSFKFCEYGYTPNTAETGDCDADYGFRVDDDIEASISTVTSFGQSGTSYAEYWFEDLYSGRDDALRVDNQPPLSGGVRASLLPHPANALPGIEGFQRTACDDGLDVIALSSGDPVAVPEPSCTDVYLGWVTWADTVSAIAIDPGYDADGLGIGMPGSADDQPHLMYFFGPDMDGFGSVTVMAGVEQTSPVNIQRLMTTANVSEPVVGLALNVLVAGDLPPETDGAALVDAGSAPGTPLTDTEGDFLMTTVHWDRFGNIVLGGETDRLAEGVYPFAVFGVDGLKPEFTDDEGLREDPADPTEGTSVYNTYDTGYFGPNQSPDGGETYGAETFILFDEDEGSAGEYFGYTTDTGNGFAGIEGVVIEDWAYATGSVAEASRFGFTLATTGLMSWTFNAGVELSNDFTISAYAEWTEGSDDGNAYRDQRVHSFDRAGNQRIVDNVTEHIVDQTEPHVDEPSRPAGPLEFGETYTFSAVLSDDVDLKKSDVSIYLQNGSGGYDGDQYLFDGLNRADEEATLLLPLANLDHTAFGSASIVNEVTASVSMALDVCIGVFNQEDGPALIEDAGEYGLGTRVYFRTWDHGSPYGRVYANSVEIEDAFGADQNCLEHESVTDPSGAILAYVNGDLVWNVDVDAQGRPVITQAGATSVFSPMVDMDDLELYYVDVAGRLLLMNTSASDWSLNVSDTGGDESDARKYTYTFTGELPDDLVAEDDLEDFYGTVGGYTFTWSLGGGVLMLWINDWDVEVE